MSDSASMLFSVVMLTYNHEKFIKESVLSIFNQDYQESFEFIIIDDDSQDDNQVMIEQIIQGGIPAHIHLNYIKNPKNIGSVASFNLAMRNVMGDVIVVADGDDISLPSRLSKIASAHRAFDKSLYISNAWVLRQDRDYRPLSESKFYTKFDLSAISIHDIYTDKTPIFGASYAFHRSLLDDYGSIDPVWVTFNNIDQQLFWRAYLKKGACYLDEKLVIYKIHQGGMTLNKMNDFNQLKKIKYLLNRMGNMLYLFEYVDHKDQAILLDKIKHNFENATHLLDNGMMVVESKLLNADIQVGYNDSIIFNGVKVFRNIQSLKTLKLDEFIFVLSRLFLDQQLNQKNVDLIYDAFKHGKISKNDIIVLFYLLNPKRIRSLRITIIDVILLALGVLKNKMRVLKLFKRISA